ncbi:hypothetical protein FDJ25_gp177 [Vibrio phage Aphrodite1]|uniref:Uncharacterized protein n=1 Tax=Vibrio phage Aphrodite1 TaxID=2070057 RepID=A0A2I7QI33_9CAUD|nr:hypothetical protein FDJ25_gp177 [Vibrio phage Aphrodite1]AUR81056.1 hypothetical protein Aphrodite1_0023 [Vibrio phage Aphrodite1]
MKASLAEMIKRLVIAQHGISLDGEFDVDPDTIRQNPDYPDRFTAEGFNNGKRIPLSWKRVSITPILNDLCHKQGEREAGEEGLYYDEGAMHHYVAVRPNHKLEDINRLLGSSFTEDQLVFRPEKFEGRWVLQHPCYYGRIFTSVLLPKAS